MLTTRSIVSRLAVLSLLNNLNVFLVVMTDPAVAYAPGEGYAALDRGSEMDIWLKAANGSYSLGAVWPGVTVYPG